jgi:nucleotide-binding universal stress UspA family protein
MIACASRSKVLGHLKQPADMKTILVGYDGTRSAEKALARAAQLARAFGGTVVVISVVAPEPVDTSGAFGLMPYSTYEPGRIDPRADEAVWQQHRAEVESFLGKAGVASKFVGVVGEPVGEIVDAAAGLGADLIVVGTREPGFLERLLGGSISQGVARHASCDVLIVHPAE